MCRVVSIYFDDDWQGSMDVEPDRHDPVADRADTAGTPVVERKEHHGHGPVCGKAWFALRRREPPVGFGLVVWSSAHTDGGATGDAMRTGGKGCATAGFCRGVWPPRRRRSSDLAWGGKKVGSFPPCARRTWSRATNVSQAARALGIDRVTLHRKLKRMGLRAGAGRAIVANLSFHSFAQPLCRRGPIMDL